MTEDDLEEAWASLADPDIGDNVMKSYVWRTVQEDLPPLLAVVFAEIKAPESDQ